MIKTISLVILFFGGVIHTDKFKGIWIGEKDNKKIQITFSSRGSFEIKTIQNSYIYGRYIYRNNTIVLVPHYVVFIPKDKKKEYEIVSYTPDEQKKFRRDFKVILKSDEIILKNKKNELVLKKSNKKVSQTTKNFFLKFYKDQSI